jgi:hypothetical protein
MKEMSQTDRQVTESMFKLRSLTKFPLNLLIIAWFIVINYGLPLGESPCIRHNPSRWVDKYKCSRTALRVSSLEADYKAAKSGTFAILLQRTVR